MVVVNPGDTVVQSRGDVVVYRLPFATWSSNLERPDDKSARISQKITTGEPLLVKTLPYAPGSQAQEVRISGGGKKRGQYEIIRTVKSATETRVRSFTVQVNP